VCVCVCRKLRSAVQRCNVTCMNIAVADAWINTNVSKPTEPYVAQPAKISNHYAAPIIIHKMSRLRTVTAHLRDITFALKASLHGVAPKQGDCYGLIDLLRPYHNKM
jgi:hypothetical protein